MKNILTIILILICHSQYYAQKLVYKATKEDHIRIRKNSKGLSLSVGDLKSVEKNGKTSWTVKATLTNHTRDTLFYFYYADCLSSNFSIWTKDDTTQLLASCENSFTDEPPIIITLSPKGRRTVDIEINATRLVTSSIKIRLLLGFHKAKNMNERSPYHGSIRTEGDRYVFLVSNVIKT